MGLWMNGGGIGREGDTPPRPAEGDTNPLQPHRGYHPQLACSYQPNFEVDALAQIRTPIAVILSRSPTSDTAMWYGAHNGAG